MLWPVAGEIIYDKYMWKAGLDDKPSSTWLRQGAFLITGLAFMAMGLGSWWQTYIFAFFTHLLFFDFTLNAFTGQKMFYHSVNDYWVKIGKFQIPANGVPPVGELFGKLVFYYSAWIAFYHWDWIQGDYPTALIDYFKF